MKRRADPRKSPTQTVTSGDPLASFKDALIGHYPSKDALLKQARVEAQRRRKRAAGATVAAVSALIATLWAVDPAWQSSPISAQFDM
jgi:ferric-dicitrate binding protein FerR (iron transport regulator)